MMYTELYQIMIEMTVSEYWLSINGQASYSPSIPDWYKKEDGSWYKKEDGSL